MYQNTSGYVHRCVKPWTGVRVRQGNRHSVPNHIPRSDVLSGMQVRGSEHNPRTCPNWTLDPCQGRDLLVGHGRIPRNQCAPGPTNSGAPCSPDSRSKLPCAPEIWHRQYPSGLRGCKWAVSAHPDIGSKRCMINPYARPYGHRGEATNPMPFEYRPFRGSMQLGSPRFPGILAARGHHVGSGGQRWQNWPSSVADHGWLSW